MKKEIKLVFQDAKSNKFWNATLNENSFKVHFGRIGTKGQEKEKTFGSADEAQKEFDKKRAEKLKEGYHEGEPASGGQ